jgi:hypothetical protein
MPSLFLIQGLSGGLSFFLNAYQIYLQSNKQISYFKLHHCCKNASDSAMKFCK